MIYIFTSKKSTALESALKPVLKHIKVEQLSRLSKGQTIQPDDMAYLDISSLSQAELKKNIGRLKKGEFFWGIIDPKGEANDPASFFFEGAGDYIGPSLIKKGLTKKRFDLAYSIAVDKGKKIEQGGKDKDIKLLTGKFEGWKSMQSGKTGTFLFLFVSIVADSSLRSLIGEKPFVTVKNRQREALVHQLTEADALLWMETEINSLFLIPPIAANGRTAVEASLKMLLNSRLFTAEKMGLSIPAELSFALHYGQSIFEAPGKTGTVVSQTINYIFHLGTKRAEAGRLTISNDVPGEVIPDGLEDLFVQAGTFEGIPIRHSKRFLYE